MLNRRTAKELHRSDGTVKVYGFTGDGELITVVMCPKGDGNYDIAEIRVSGKIC